MISLVIDCGTTNLRVTLVDENNQPVDVIKANGGVRHTAIDGNNNRLKAMLKNGIDTLLERNGKTAEDVARCVAYGMITSNMGLLEIPHLSAPASAAELRAGMQEKVFPEIAPFPISFIPGVRNFAGAVDLENFSMMDMMRGEEVEAVGLYSVLGLTGPAVFILPGSHNKFVAMAEGGKILGCMTSISGELLDSVTHHTILADAVNHSFVEPELYNSELACAGALECAKSGLGRAAFAGRILQTLGGKPASAIQSYLLGAVLALDVQAMEAFIPESGDAPEIPVYQNIGLSLGVAPDAAAAKEKKPEIFVAGKAPIQQAMIDVLKAMGHEGAKPVPAEVSAKMGLCGAVKIAF